MSEKEDSNSAIPEEKPSPVDVLGRWPLAIMALSALCLDGDQKYADDGRSPGRGQALDFHLYGEEYSREKMLRHEAFDASGVIFDHEFGHYHITAVAWHALHRLEARLHSVGYSMHDIVEGTHTWSRRDGADS